MCRGTERARCVEREGICAWSLRLKGATYGEKREEGIQGRDCDVRVARCLAEASGDPDGMQVSLQFITRAVQSSRGFR